jgi:transposase
MDWGTRNKSLSEKVFDKTDWQKYYHRHQQEHIRKRLKAVKLYYEGKKREAIAQELGITYKTLSGYLDMYIANGLEGLTKAIEKPRAKKLSSSQEAQLRHIVLQERPEAFLKKEIFGH